MADRSASGRQTSRQRRQGPAADANNQPGKQTIHQAQVGPPFGVSLQRARAEQGRAQRAPPADNRRIHQVAPYEGSLRTVTASSQAALHRKINKQRPGGCRVCGKLRDALEQHASKTDLSTLPFSSNARRLESCSRTTIEGQPNMPLPVGKQWYRAVVSVLVA